MHQGKRILALVPARGGSKGLPGKNIRWLLDKPLIAWSIEAAKGSRYVDRTIVTTDSEEIARVAMSSGGEAPFLRPAALAADDSPSIDVILHALDWLREQGDIYDYLVLLEPTSPLREASDIDNAIGLLVANLRAESIVGVAKVEAAHPAFLCSMKDGFLTPFQQRDFVVKRRQEIEDYYFFEGSLYISTCSALRKKRGFYHDKTLGYVMPKWKSYEIDEVSDFIIIEALAKARRENLIG